MSDERIEALETRLAHQEHGLQQLSEELWTQQQTIDRLTATIDALRRRLQSLSDDGGDAAPADERPPHY